jgi:hypothetical protein
VDIPQECMLINIFFFFYSLRFSLGFYSFLFAHPILIVKNSHWFKNENNKSDDLTDNELLNDINRTQSSSSLQVLKHQLGILSKLYRNELQVRQAGGIQSSGKEENLNSV